MIINVKKSSNFDLFKKGDIVEFINKPDILVIITEDMKQENTEFSGICISTPEHPNYLKITHTWAVEYFRLFKGSLEIKNKI